MKRGNITLATATVVSAILALVGSYFVSQSAAQDKVATVQADVSALKAQQIDQQMLNNTVQNDIDRLNNKVDALLIHFGINPSNIAQK